MIQRRKGSKELLSNNYDITQHANVWDEPPFHAKINPYEVLFANQC